LPVSNNYVSQKPGECPLSYAKIRTWACNGLNCKPNLKGEDAKARTSVDHEILPAWA
jgi:hypothetical protein